jgi:hypothetical protein
MNPEPTRQIPRIDVLYKNDSEAMPLCIRESGNCQIRALELAQLTAEAKENG